MQSSIFYFSGTGNTEWIVQETKEKLDEKNHKTDIYKIENINIDSDSLIASAIEQSDYIGFAFPMYGADIPRIMKQFMSRFIGISNSNKTSSPKLFFINTFGYVNGCGVFRARKLLKSCKYPIHAYFNFRLVSNTSSDIKSSMLGANMPDKYKIKSSIKIDKLIYSLETDRKIIQGIGPHLLVGILIRRILRDEVHKNYMNMSVNMSKCIRCMKCVKSCPTQSIEFIDELFSFKYTCETCWRCSKICPENALSMNKRG